MQLVFINLVFLVDTLRISSSTCAIVLQLGEAEAVSFLPRGEASALKHTSLHLRVIHFFKMNLVLQCIGNI